MSNCHGKVDLLVIQPTPFCNINCSYCYLPDRLNPKRITIEAVEKVIDALIEDNLLINQKTLSIVWHAGEPMVLPPSFYKPLFQIIETKLFPRGINVNHSIQTNATLISQDWCDFINQTKIKIGLSVDGPRYVHDANRKTRSGKGTFDKVMDGLKLLQENNIPYHGIAVVNEASLNAPEEFFDFFYNNGFYQLGLNIEEIEGVHQQSSIFKKTLYEKVVSFYSSLFNLYMNSDKHMGIREFDQSLSAILRNPETLDIRKIIPESHQNIPLAIISVDYQGNFSSFSPELIGQVSSSYKNFIFGNVFHSSFIHSKSVEFQLITKEIEKGIQKCEKECDYFHVCGGGAPANKFFENGTFASSETNYCKYNIKIPTDIVIEFLEAQLSSA